MENILKSVEVRLITNEEQSLKIETKSNFDHRVIFGEHLAAVHMRKTKIKFDKPIYLEFSILDISKTSMADFVYKNIKPTYRDKATISYTYTDSIVYNMETPDVYKDINEHGRQWFDISNYPSDHTAGVEAGLNRKMIVIFKDKCVRVPMTECVGLRPKMNASNVVMREARNVEGVRKCVVKT